MNYKEKIKKLLALSESPVEAEATAALTKARELMAKYKIEQGELGIMTNEKLVRKDIPGIRFHTHKEFWINSILWVIQENFPVTVIATYYQGKKSFYPAVAGFADDVEIVEQIILYIWDSVHHWAKTYCKNHNITKTKDKNSVINGYGFGFTDGWRIALSEQKEQHSEWGLVLQKPDISSIVTYTKKRSKANRNASIEVDGDAVIHGRKDGYSYGTRKRIEK